MKNKFILLILVYGTIFAILFLNQNFISFLKVTNKQKELRYEIKDLEKEIKDLKIEIKKLRFDAFYVEKIAREKYLMIKDGEEVFKFND